MTMRCLMFLASLVATTHALALAAAPAMRLAAPVTMQFGGQKLTPAEKLEQKGYWPGEWVCSDCGFIYEPGTTPAFEELRQKWKCPQCAGPRRRFVKKAGNSFGQVDDSPVIIGTVATAVITAVLVYLGLTI